MSSELASQKANLTPLQEQLVGMRAVTWSDCPHCRGSNCQWRGYREQKKAIIHRRWCKTCNKWFIGERHTEKTLPEETAEHKRFLNEKLAHDAWIEAFQEAQHAQGGETR